MAVVAAYNFNALLGNGKVPDMAGYGRDLTLDSGVALTAGHDNSGLQCDVGGATATYASGDYIGNGTSFSCFAWVKSLSSTPAVRVIAESVRGSDRIQSFLLSNTSGHLAARITVGGSGTDDTYSSGVSVLDGAWHFVGVAYDGIVGSGTGKVTFWVDGAVVATITRGTGDIAEQGGTFVVGRSVASPTTSRANAVIDDLRWFNDPVYMTATSGEPEAALFSAPVQNLVVAAYNFDEAGSVVRDYTLRHNDLALTASGSRAAAVNNNGLFSTRSHGAEADVTLWTGGAFDRLTVCGWVKVTTTGSAAPFISLEDASGTPKFQVFRGGSLGLLGKVWGSSGVAPLDGTFIFTEDFALSTSEWRFFYFNVNPTGIQGYVLQADGTKVGDTGNGSGSAASSTGNPPTNMPIISGVSKVRLGGGVAALDDVRIIRNFLNLTAVRDVRLAPVTQEPAGVLSNLAIGDLSVAGFAVGDSTVSGIALGDTLVFGA